MSGPETIHLLRQKRSEVAIIALTSFAEEALIRAALQAGARGFLYKDVSVDELATAIRLVHAGRTLLDAKAADVMQHLLNSPASGAAPTPKPVLSKRELEVLR